ncbi:hypothetical protein [Nostoc sp.]|uniref:hypothetical protein n=1 Tax=Nostoc sp. TaxID=1180 RepID=UPI002FF56F30
MLAGKKRTKCKKSLFVSRPTIYLKTGEKIEVLIEELEDYLEQNEDNIQVQKVKSCRCQIRVKAT